MCFHHSSHPPGHTPALPFSPAPLPALFQGIWIFVFYAFSKTLIGYRRTLTILRMARIIVIIQVTTGKVTRDRTVLLANSSVSWTNISLGERL